MELTEEQLSELERMSAALMPPSEIAILLKIEPIERELFVQICKNHKQDEIYDTYQRGRLHTKLKLHSTVVKLAIAGSPAAEPLAEKFIREQSMSE